MKAVIFTKQSIRGNVMVEEGCLALALTDAEYRKVKDKLLKLGFKEVSEEEKTLIPTVKNPPKPADVKLTSDSPLYILREE